MVYKLIVSIMLFVLSWTGTFLHDLAEDWCDGQHCETAIISRTCASDDLNISEALNNSNGSNLSNPSEQKKTLEDIDSDGHFHMAVIASQNHDELLKGTNNRAAQIAQWASNSVLTEASRERPPPLLSTRLSFQKNYLTTRRLLI